MMAHPYYGGPTGIETVHERGQGAYQFGQYYDNLCALQSSVPLTNVKSNLDRHILQINADKIRLTDWPPILKALRINKSLEKVAIHSYYDPEPDTPQATGSKTPSQRSYTPSKQKIPPVHAKDMTYQLCKALKDCLTSSDQLRSVELEGLPFRSRDIHLISKGISESCSLKEVSLNSSHIGDGLSVLCEGLKNASTVNMINLSGCGLADGAVEAIAKVVKHQAIMRHSEAWKSSLRYRAPDLDCMPGLRRITLNRNPLLGDDAAKALADALKDDLWLKAVDLQECGLTDTGAEYLLNALRLNSTVLVVDIRGNHLVNRSLVERIIQQVMINSDGKTTQFSWLPVDADRKKSSLTRNYGKSISAKKSSPTFKTPTCKSKTLVISPSRKRSAAPTGSPPITPRSVPKQRGLPWRTAERASVHKFIDEADKENNTSIQNIHLHRDDEGSLSSENSYTREKSAEAYPRRAPTTDQETLAMLKELQAENISLKRRLAEESTARLAAEDRALESARENRRLQAQLRRASLADNGADEELLTQVEAAFSKFNQFLDLVRDTGLGHLIHEAGLDTFAGTSSPIPSPVRCINPNSFTSRASTSQDIEDVALKRRIALQSDDIIQPVPSTDSPQKSYSEILAGDSIKALAEALKTAPGAEKQVSTPTKAKKKRKDKSKTGGAAAPDLSSGTYKIKAFELKDISELEMPKLTPRAQVDVMKSTEGFPDLPRDSEDDGVKLPVAQASADFTDSRDVASVAVGASTDRVTEEANYSMDDFASVSATVTDSNKLSGSGSQRDIDNVSEPDLSPISYTDSDDQGKSERMNIKSLSELGSSVEDITSTKDV